MRIVIRQLVIAGVLAALVVGCAGRRYGTTHQMYVQQIGARIPWIAACQPARDSDGDGEIRIAFGQHGEPFGDAMMPFVFLEHGPPLEAEAVYDATTDQRFIAVSVAGRLVLVDATTGRRSDIAPAPPWSPVVSRVAFSYDGRALFARVDGAVLARDLATGHTTRTPLPAGVFAFPEAGPGDSIFLRELITDPDPDRHFVSDHATITGHVEFCFGLPLSFRAEPVERDFPTSAIVSPSTGSVTRIAARLHPFASGYVAERAGELTFHAADGSERSLRPPNAPGCRPTPLHVDPTRELMLFHCGQGEHGMLYAWTARSGVRALSDFRGVVARESVERYPRLLRVFPLRANGDRLRSRAVLDLDTLEVKDVRGVPTYSAGPRVVTRTLVPEWAPTHWEVAWFDSETGTRRILNAPDWIPRRAAGDFIVLGHSVYDMRTGQRRGGFDDRHDEWGQGCRLVGLDGTGRVLIRENPEDRGPLLWVQPGWF